MNRRKCSQMMQLWKLVINPFLRKPECLIRIRESAAIVKVFCRFLMPTRMLWNVNSWLRGKADYFRAVIDVNQKQLPTVWHVLKTNLPSNWHFSPSHFHFWNAEHFICFKYHSFVSFWLAVFPREPYAGSISWHGHSIHYSYGKKRFMPSTVDRLRKYSP